jgi:oligopeptide/dipeptide ABC transporter ATP-binding protein
MADTLVEIRGLKLEFSGFDGVSRVLDGVDLTLKRGEILGIVGETGSGKTMTALSIAHLVPNGVLTGSVLFEGEEVLTKSGGALQRFRAQRLGMVFQDPTTNLNPVFSIGELLTDAVLVQKYGIPGWKLLPVGRWFNRRQRQQAREEAIALLDRVGIPDAAHRMNSYAHQLSGGQKQRVLIAIALAGNPDLLIADEPTTALDVAMQAQILRLIQELVRERNMSAIVITHDLGVVARICDRITVMYGGIVAESGTVRDIFENPKHPYTKGLLEAIPTDQVERGMLRGIHGAPPSFLKPPTGCRFHPRCPARMSHCHLHPPAVARIGPTHETACYLYTDERHA